MFLMNRFFDGEFMTFGLDVIAYMESDQEDRVDPMIYIFPRYLIPLFKKNYSNFQSNPYRIIVQTLWTTKLSIVSYL